MPYPSSTSSAVGTIDHTVSIVEVLATKPPAFVEMLNKMARATIAEETRKSSVNLEARRKGIGL